MIITKKLVQELSEVEVKAEVEDGKTESYTIKAKFFPSGYEEKITTVEYLEVDAEFKEGKLKWKHQNFKFSSDIVKNSYRFPDIIKNLDLVADEFMILIV